VRHRLRQVVGSVDQVRNPSLHRCYQSKPAARIGDPRDGSQLSVYVSRRCLDPVEQTGHVTHRTADRVRNRNRLPPAPNGIVQVTP
jgi:hypothetical protein